MSLPGIEPGISRTYMLSGPFQNFFNLACAKTWTELWTMDCGQWTMGYGLWTVDCRLSDRVLVLWMNRGGQILIISKRYRQLLNKTI